MPRLGFRRTSLVLTLIIAAAIAAALIAGKVAPRDTAYGSGDAEGAPALSNHLAKLHLASSATFAPAGSSNYREGDVTASDEEFAQRAYPGNDIPVVALQQSHSDWTRYGGRGDEGSAQWTPLGPTYAKGLPNPYRDRSVYTAGTANFSGRDAFVAIDPNCGSKGHGDNYRKSAKDDGRGNDNHNNGNDESSCRLWLANANGGIWRTDNALSKNPQWKYLSRVFQHNNTASIQLDPNDKSGNTLWVGTGEPNACGSGCEAGVGLYRSTDGGDHWTGPYGQDAFYDRAVGSIAIEQGNSNIMYAASGRAIRGLTSTCCGGADALIPGAPHFGVYRSTDGGQHWELVNQGASALCNTVSPDVVSTNGTPCSPRGARRVLVDPVDPHTVYASFFARGIWRSNHDGAAGSWEQIMAPVDPLAVPGAGKSTTERPEFDVVADPATHETRMYVGVGGGTVYARFRENLAVRNAPAAAVAASWIDKSSATPTNPTSGTSSGYCDTQCSYDNYVYIPAAHFPQSGASIDTVYLSGSNRYAENNWGPLSVHCCPDNPATGRSDGRAVIVSTDAGTSFTDMTADHTSDRIYPSELHPDQHALVVNPTNWKQFFAVGDGGIVRSNGNFANSSADCADPNVKGLTGEPLVYCQAVLSRVPETLTTINAGLRTLHFYELSYSPFDPNLIVAGAQDNGSWEIGDTQGSGTNGPDPLPNTVGEPSTKCRTDAGRSNDGDSGNDHNTTSQNQVWVQINIADGGQNNFDIGDPCFRQSAWQSGQLMVAYTPKNQLDMNWIADTLLGPYGNEATAAFMTPVINDPVHPHWMFTGREHVFRSLNQGRNPVFTKAQHRAFCNVWYGTFSQTDSAGNYIPCDDWQPLGDPGAGGRLTSTTYGPDKIKTGADYVTSDERSKKDSGTLWAATAGGRVFVSKNADAASPTAVTFDRIDNDPTAGPTPARFVSAISIDPNDPNHAIVVFSGFNVKTPGTPGHIFDVHYIPGASTWKLLDGNQPSDALGDIPATSVALTAKGTIYVGTDYGVVSSFGDGVWRQAAAGLPALVAADLMYVPEKQKLYVATHGQGVWELPVDGIEAKDHHGHGDGGHGNGH